jgi:hypothetical protein
VIRRPPLVPAPALALALTLLLGAFLDASADTISDGDFGSWTFGSSVTPEPGYPAGTGSATATVQSSVGNPAPDVLATTGFNYAIVEVHGVKTDYSTMANLQGKTWTLTIDAKYNSGYPSQNFGLVVEQGGSIWGSRLPGILNFNGSAWHTGISVSDTFTPGAFYLLAGSGSPTLDFSGGVATQFGFFASDNGTTNLTGANAPAYEYDNWSLNSAPLQAQDQSAAVPEIDPGSAASAVALLGCGVVMWSGRRNRKRPGSGIVA